MRVKRVACALALAVVSALGGAGAGWAADWVPYTGPGEWFWSGRGVSAYYDHCGYWVNNTFSKAPSAHGLITFIDLGGNWSYGKQGTGVLRRTLTAAESRPWVKKPFCRNNSAVGYQGGCYGYIEPETCA